MSINSHNVILTFDYEVFLGRKTGTVENCVIKPTKLILDVLKSNNAKAIFFVDAAWLLFLKETSNSDFQNVTLQLKEIINSGSSVELHLHSQWLQAYKKEDEISFSSFKNYSLPSLSRNEIHNLFKESIDLLEGITNQKVHCFRAGGFCIEPFTQIKDSFETFGIKYDFSVVPGMSLREGEVYDFDFSKAPEVPFYKFQDNLNNPDINGRFVEVPLSTYKSNPLYRIVNKLMLRIKQDRILGDGIGIQEKQLISFRSVKSLLQHTRGMLSLDNTWSRFFGYLLKVHFRRSALLVIISHPKTISPEAIRNLNHIAKNHTLSSDDLDKYLS